MTGRGRSRAAAMWVFVFVLGGIPASMAMAESALGTFEKDATRPRPSTPHGSHDHGYDGDASVAPVPVYVAPDAPPAPPPPPPRPREPGDAQLPLAQIDAGWIHVNDHISATRVRLEVGKGPIALQAIQTRYTEKGASTDLRLTERHVMLRAANLDGFGIAFGLGSADLDGETHHSGTSLTLPITIRLTTALGVEYRPSWTTINGNGITDEEFAVNVGGRFWAVRAGYHVLESPGEKLSGPFAGVSVRY